MHLSKTRILAGLQCEKRLYLMINQPELAKTSKSPLAETGIVVGEQARKEFSDGAHVNRYFFEQGLRICNLVYHPESQNEIRGTVNAKPVRITLPEVDAIRQALATGTAARPVHHLRLNINRDDSSTRPNKPCKSKAEIPQTAPYIYDGLTGCNVVTKNRIGIVKQAPDWIIKSVTEPPRAGMRPQVQGSAEQTDPFRTDRA